MENNIQFVKCEEATKIQLFDYIKNPLDRTMVKTLVRLYQDIPVFAGYILNEILDRLDDDGRIKMSLKKDWPKIINLLQGYSKQAIKRYAEDEEKYNCNTVVGEMNVFEKMLHDFNNYLRENHDLEEEIWYKDKEIFKRFEKFHKNFIEWAFKIEAIANIENENNYMKEIADKATFLYRLKKGDQFSFVDNPSFHEFTFIETKTIDRKEEADVVCYYKNIYNETQVFYESNIYRPVIITKNIFSKNLNLKMVSGCTADSLTINGKEEINLTPNERKEIWRKIIKELGNEEFYKNIDEVPLNELLQFVLERFGNYSQDDKPCEQCGDWVCRYELDIHE